MGDASGILGLRDGLRGELAAWPAGVRAELERRARELRARATGRVLDLDDPAARALVLERGTDLDGGDGGAPDAGEADTVVSIAALAELADLPAAVRGIERLLRTEGELLFLEPVARPGWVGLLGASAGATLRPLRGHHLGRDVPLAIRATTFIITDIERFTMPTSLWPLRPFVQGRAVRFDGLGR